MTLEQLQELIDRPTETEILEFKAARRNYSVLGKGAGEFKRQKNSIYGYCVGIGNSGGGKLILGVSNTIPRKKVGTGLLTSLITIREEIYEKLGIKITTDEVHTDDNKRIVIIGIPSRPTGTLLRFYDVPLDRSGE